MMTWVVIRDMFVLEKCFDTKQEAEKHRDHCRRCYQGSFVVAPWNDKDISDYSALVTDMDFVQSIGMAYQ
jgi:hypothetical protein